MLPQFARNPKNAVTGIKLFIGKKLTEGDTKSEIDSVPFTVIEGADGGPSFAYSLPMHPVHTRRDRVASLPPRCLYGAVIPRAPPLGHRTAGP